MKIRYSRSGGLANIKMSIEIDSEQLAPAKEKEIRSLLDAAKLSQKPMRSDAKASMPDDLQHELEVQEGERHHHVLLNDSECTVDQLRLFDRLHQESIQSRSRKRNR